MRPKALACQGFFFLIKKEPDSHSFKQVVVDPDLQIRGWGVGGGGGVGVLFSQKSFFGPLNWASFWSKNGGGGRPPWSLPWIRH